MTSGGHEAAKALIEHNSSYALAPQHQASNNVTENSLVVQADAKPVNEHSLLLAEACRSVRNSIQKLVGVWEDEVLPYEAKYKKDNDTEHKWWNDISSMKSMRSRLKTACLVHTESFCLTDTHPFCLTHTSTYPFCVTHTSTDTDSFCLVHIDSFCLTNNDSICLVHNRTHPALQVQNCLWALAAFVGAASRQEPWENNLWTSQRKTNHTDGGSVCLEWWDYLLV